MTLDQAYIDKHLRDVIKRAKAARIALTLGGYIQTDLYRIDDALQAAISKNNERCGFRYGEGVR